MNEEIPVAWSRTHFEIAESHGILRDRIVTFRNATELREFAASRGVEEEKLKSYHEMVLGVRIQEDDHDLKGPNYWILLRQAFPLACFADMYLRLVGGDLDPSLEIADHTRPDMLQRFVLLHEIAHHVLGHGHQCDEDESEADRWAFERLSPAPLDQQQHDQHDR